MEFFALQFVDSLSSFPFFFSKKLRLFACVFRDVSRCFEMYICDAQRRGCHFRDRHTNFAKLDARKIKYLCTFLIRAISFTK